MHVDLDDKLLTIADAARRLRVHVSTLHRWRTRGIRGAKLNALKLGGRWYVREQDLADFIAATTAAATGEQSSTQAQARRAAEFAGQQLDAVLSRPKSRFKE